MSLVEAVAGAVRGVVVGGGWPGLAAVMAVENVVPLVPSEVVLPLAGSQVASGQLSYLVAVLAATAGSVLGAWALYLLGRGGGRPVVLRLHWLLRMDERRLARSQDWFARRGALLVLVGHVVPGVRGLVSVPAGMAHLPPWRFTVLTAVGSLVWNAALIGAGEALAARWTAVAGVVSQVSTDLLLAAAVALPAAWLWRRARAAEAAGTALRVLLAEDHVASGLYPSPLTVKAHVNRAMAELDVRDRARPSATERLSTARRSTGDAQRPHRGGTGRSRTLEPRPHRRSSVTDIEQLRTGRGA